MVKSQDDPGQQGDFLALIGRVMGSLTSMYRRRYRWRRYWLVSLRRGHYTYFSLIPGKPINLENQVNHSPHQPSEISILSQYSIHKQINQNDCKPESTKFLGVLLPRCLWCVIKRGTPFRRSSHECCHHSCSRRVAVERVCRGICGGVLNPH